MAIGSIGSWLHCGILCSRVWLGRNVCHPALKSLCPWPLRGHGEGSECLRTSVPFPAPTPATGSLTHMRSENQHMASMVLVVSGVYICHVMHCAVHVKYVQLFIYQ